MASETRLTHLQALEAESIHILRETAAEMERPVMLYSMGKDSGVLLHLARNEVAPRDVHLLLFRIPGQRDDFHAIEQCRVHGPELVGGRDEEDAREIERHLEVVVPE